MLIKDEILLNFAEFGIHLKVSQKMPFFKLSDTFCPFISKQDCAEKVTFNITVLDKPQYKADKVIFTIKTKAKSGLWNVVQSDSCKIIQGFIYTAQEKKAVQRAVILDDKFKKCEIQFFSPAFYKKFPLEPLGYPFGELILVNLLANKESIYIHASGALTKDKGLLFVGQSGSGKSTLSRLLQLGKFGSLLSDERIILRKINGQFYMFGTPWSGSERIISTQKGPLHNIFFIEHGQSNRIIKLQRSEAFRRMLKTLFVPYWDREKTAAILDTADRLSQEAPCYALQFRPTMGISSFLRRYIHG